MNIPGQRNQTGFTVEYGAVEGEKSFGRRRSWKSQGKWPIDDSWLLPDKYTRLQIDGPIRQEDVKFPRLLRLLQHDDRRWDTIWFRDNGPSSPAFLSILFTACNRADSLVIAGVMDDPAIFCLSTGLLLRDGIKRLKFSSPQNVFTHAQMTLLSQGLSRSTSLEFLSIPINREQPAVQALVPGLQANESLKSLTLNWCDYDHLLLVLPSLHTHPTLKKFTLENSYGVPVYPEFQESLRTWLSREDCKLEDVCLDEFYTYEFDVEEGNFALDRLDRPNTSLRILHSGCLNVTSHALSSMLPDLKGLVVLDLFYNDVTDLEPLDCLLLGESCRLETLILEFNPIEVSSARIFSQKLPRMKVLRHLSIGDNPFTEDEEFLKEFATYVYENESLEILRLETDYKSLIPKIKYGPCLNRAGRRHLGKNPGGTLPLQLLPTVLVRTGEIKYHSRYRRPADPSDHFHELDANFWLLRENGALFTHLKNEFLQE